MFSGSSLSQKLHCNVCTWTFECLNWHMVTQSVPLPGKSWDHIECTAIHMYNLMSEYG